LSASRRDKSKKKAQGAEEQNKPGIEALGRVDSRLNGCVAWDKKKRGGYPFTMHLLIFLYYLHSCSYSSLAMPYLELGRIILFRRKVTSVPDP
jgi:hypothetical protein